MLIKFFNIFTKENKYIDSIFRFRNALHSIVLQMKKILKMVTLLFVLVIISLYFIPFTQKTVFAYYGQDDEFIRNLKDLRSKSMKTVQVNDIQWKYYTGGSGSKCILFIHGMGGSYDFWWNQLRYFEPQYKVISYTLPNEINSLEGVESGIMAILAQEKIEKFIPIGTSMGGYITQYLLTKHPEKVEKAVIGNSFPPNDYIAKENATNRILIPLLPEYLVGKMAESHLKKDIFPTSENNRLLEAFLLSVPFSKKGLASRFDVVTDTFVATPEKPEVKAIPKLILESDNDPMITPDLRSQLKTLYPEAHVFTFHNKGHFPYINDMDTYNKIVIDFLMQ
jgi:maspardin